MITTCRINQSKVVQRCLYPSESTTNFDHCTMTTNIVVNKSTDNAGLLSVCFLPQYSTSKEVFISESYQNHDIKKERASLVYNLVFFFPNSAFLIGYYIA